MKSVVEFPQIMRFHLITSSNLSTSPAMLPVFSKQLPTLIGPCDLETSITNSRYTFCLPGGCNGHLLKPDA